MPTSPLSEVARLVELIRRLIARDPWQRWGDSRRAKCFWCEFYYPEHNTDPECAFVSAQREVGEDA